MPSFQKVEREEGVFTIVVESDEDGYFVGTTGQANPKGSKGMKGFYGDKESVSIVVGSIGSYYSPCIGPWRCVEGSVAGVIPARSLLDEM